MLFLLVELSESLSDVLAMDALCLLFSNTQAAALQTSNVLLMRAANQ